MNSATLINSKATLSAPQYVIANYEYALGLDSTAFISIELPGLAIDEPSYRQVSKTNMTGKSYAIDLATLSISCVSSDFDINVLNINDETKLNTINEVISHLSINKIDVITFDRYIISNEDTIMDNKLYMMITNNAGGDAGTVAFQLIYTTLQDRI